MQTNEELEGELYRKLDKLGININSVKEIKLTIAQLQEFYHKIKQLKDRYPCWYGDAN